MSPSRLLVALNVVWIILAAVAWMRVETCRRRIDELERSQSELEAALEALRDRESERAAEAASQWETIRANRLLIEGLERKAGEDR